MKIFILGGSVLMIAYSITTHNMVGFTGWLGCIIYTISYVIRDDEE